MTADPPSDGAAPGFAHIAGTAATPTGDLLGNTIDIRTAIAGARQ